MQEHIRRAHPSHYIPKLPATEESFMLMVNSQRPGMEIHSIYIYPFYMTRTSLFNFIIRMSTRISGLRPLIKFDSIMNSRIFVKGDIRASNIR